METFKKRQKEMKRLERQRDKAARRVERKQHRANGEPLPEGLSDSDEAYAAPSEGDPTAEPTAGSAAEQKSDG